MNFANYLSQQPLDEQHEVSIHDIARATVERRQGSLILHFIQSEQKGGGSKMLIKICETADELNLPIMLHVHPIKHYARIAGIVPLSKHDLKSWYGRYGFEGEFDSMIRQPKGNM